MESNQILSMLIQVCSAFFENLDRRVLITRILDTAIKMTRSDRGTVFLLPRSQMAPMKSRRGVQLTSLIATGLEGKEIKVNITQGIAGHVFRTNEALLINDVQRDSRFFPAIDQETNYHTETILCAPLRVPSGQTLGVLEILNSKKGHFEEQDLQLLQVLALFAAVALEQREAIDSLTDVNEKLNLERRYWMKQAEKCILQSSHSGLQEIYDKLPTFAQSDSNILIEGESGTGKEVIAQVVHLKSKRPNMPFIALNCAAIPESLFEAELFGVAPGAATGTVARRGKLELAEGGTLFLDEIGEVPLSIQVKLLRVLQEKAVSRVGSEELPKQIDFRIIAATNKNLEQLVRDGKFREDLYYRINVIRFYLPPLRERPGDIEMICSSILEAFVVERGWKLKTLSESALKHFRAYAWPGNIRQLQNKLESAVIVSADRQMLEVDDFQLTLGTLEKSIEGVSGKVRVVLDELNLKHAKDRIEREVIRQALNETGGNRTEAAKLLGITREGLRRAMLKWPVRGA